MASDLKSKAIRAGAWALLGELGLRIVQFAVAVILARLLLPEQFGLIGMLIIFTAVAQTIMDSGFGVALIQKKNVTDEDINSVFYFNIFVGFLVYAILFILAPYVADFYNQPILTELLRVLAITLIINSFGITQNVLMMKKLDFEAQTKVTLIAIVISGVVAITMAYKGYGVWSIVAHQISNAFVETLFFWIFSKWRPSYLFSLASLKQLFNFGSKMLASSLLNTVFENIYHVVIGKIFAPAVLGYYTRAESVQQLTSRTLTAVIGKVALPVFSAIQDDPERMKRGMKKAITMMMLFNVPMMIGLAIIAKPFIVVLLGEIWEPCVIYIQLLCLLGILYPLQVINLSVLQAMGKSDIFLKLEIIKKLLIVGNVLITFRWGVTAMICGQVVVSFINYGLNSYHSKRLINYSMMQQIYDFFPYLLTSALMAIPVYSLAYLPVSLSILLVSQCILGVLLYAALCHIFRLRAYDEAKLMVFNSLAGEFSQKEKV